MSVPDPSIRTNRRIFYTRVATFVGVFVLAWSFSHTLHRMPTMPTPRPPSPNAFDDYKRASGAMKHVEECDVLYTEWSRTTAPALTVAQIAQADRIVAANSRAFGDIQRGLTHQYSAPQSYGFDILTPYLAHYRMLSYLLAIKSSSLAAHGDSSGAISAAIDAIQLGVQIPCGGNLMSGLVGYSCQQTGQRAARSVLDRIPAPVAIAAARRLAAIDCAQVHFADILAGEERFGARSIEKMLDQRREPREFVKAVRESDEYGNYALVMYLEPDDVIMGNYLDYMDLSVKHARQSYKQWSHSPHVSLPRDPINQVIVPQFDSARLQFERATCNNRLLEIQLALQSYRASHGRYPASLTAISPAIIPAVPEDPFADSSSFRYRGTAKGNALYSVGPDGVDDRGKPIEQNDAQHKDRGRYAVTDPALSGDYVAGINY
ncbi:MAG TPA: hypothetical protein VGK19_22290 [Capsulimonadaceae bacterium]|jgi:hypothetical protein